MAEFDEKLITSVQKYPCLSCLYDNKLSDFKVSLKKDNAWTAIASNMNCSGKQQMYVQHFQLLF